MARVPVLVLVPVPVQDQDPDHCQDPGQAIFLVTVQAARAVDNSVDMLKSDATNIEHPN